LEFKRRWKRLHGYHNFSDAKRDYKDLVFWLGQINHEALTSLEEAEMDTLTVIKLEVPKVLKTTLSSTNPIESVFSIAKPKMIRVKNWKSGSNQLVRWSASALLEAEKKFRTVKGYLHLPKLSEQLNKLFLDKQEEVA